MPQTPITEGAETPDIMCVEIDLTPEDEAALEAVAEKRVAAYVNAKAGDESEDEDEETDDQDGEETEEDGSISEDRKDRFTWRDEDIKWV